MLKLSNLPWWVTLPASLGITAMTAFLPDLSPFTKYIGFLAGAILFAWSGIAALWHWIKQTPIAKPDLAALPREREWISLDDTIRYVGQKSAWAASQNNDDYLLSARVSQLIQDALICGDVKARARKFHILRGGIRKPPLCPMEPINADYWKAARFDSYWALQGRIRNIASDPAENAVLSGEYDGARHSLRSKAGRTSLATESPQINCEFSAGGRGLNRTNEANF